MDVGYNEDDKSITIPTIIELPPPPKLCPFLDGVHCTDPRVYKRGVPNHERALYLCTLGGCGVIPRWCKQYPYQKKDSVILEKIRGFIQKSTLILRGVTK